MTDTTDNVTTLPGFESFTSKDQRIVRQCAETGEPVFVFRAKDLLSVQVLNHYARLTEDMLPSDASIVEQILERIQAFKDWQQSNTGKVRLPD